MNTRLSLNLICNFPLKKQKGFAMAFALTLGIVTALVAITMIIRAQGDQSKVVSSANTAKADALAEAGATRYVDFLNNHPVLLSAADHTAWATQWTSYLNGTIDGTGQSTSGGSPTPQSGATCQNTNKDSAGNTVTPTPSNPDGVTSSAITSTWSNPSNQQVVGNGNGKIQLVGYKYNSARNTAVLGIQGIVGVGSAGQATAQVKYTFQVGQRQSTPASPSPSGNPIIPQTNPGLWARSFSTSAIAYANVLDSSGCVSGSQFDSSVGNLPQTPVGDMPNGNHTPTLSGTSAGITRQNVPFPPLPTYPSSFTSLVTANKVKEIANCSRTQYPTTGDYDSDGNAYSSSTTAAKIYSYHITGTCTLPSNVQFGTTGKGNETMVMYVDSTFSASNNANLATNGTGKAKVLWLLKTSSLSYGGNAQVGSSNAGTAENWAFFLYNPSATLGMQGTSDIYAFIFAPYSSANMGGNPKIAGGLWVNSFSTNGNPPKIFQATTQAGINALFTAAYTASGDTNYANYAPNSTAVTTNSVSGVTGFQKQAVSDTNTFLASAFPAIPAAPSASIASSVVQPSVYWNATTGATAYSLYRCEGSSATPTCVPGTSIQTYTTPPSSSTPYVEASLPSAVGRRWCYAAVASNDGGDAKGGTTCGAFR